MLKTFFQQYLKGEHNRCFGENFNNFLSKLFSKILKGFICLIITLSMFSCAKDNRRKGRTYNPNGSYVPNSRYYSKPYELLPRGYGDYDQYYVYPYGYGQGDGNYSPTER